ncbi:hypothetical protein TNCV_2953411 [Trichonephila clavipes]|nr:hypothetical protein TNCV_2953411 [Trichonephila clavipes]
MFLSVYSNTSTYATPIYVNPEQHVFQISSIRLLFERYTTRCVELCPAFSPVTAVESVSELDEIGNVIEEVVDLASK